MSKEEVEKALRWFEEQIPSIDAEERLAVLRNRLAELEPGYEVGYEDGENSREADYACLVQDFPEDFDNDARSPMDAIKELLARYKKLEAAVPRWISVAERLPDISEKEYLVFSKTPHGAERQHFATLYEDEWYSFHPMTCSPMGPDQYKHVTHWQPLPALPATEESISQEADEPA